MLKPFSNIWRECLTRYMGPWIVSIQRPAPGGKVRSAHADAETISGISTLTRDLSLCADLCSLPEGLCDNCLSPLLTWKEWNKRITFENNKWQLFVPYKHFFKYFLNYCLIMKSSYADMHVQGKNLLEK